MQDRAKDLRDIARAKGLSYRRSSYRSFICLAPSLSYIFPGHSPQVKTICRFDAFYSLRDSRPANQRTAFAAMRTHWTTRRTRWPCRACWLAAVNASAV